MMWGPYGFGGGFGGMAWMPFLGIFFWLLIIGLIVFGVRAMFGPRHPWAGHWHPQDGPAGAHPSGLAILDERYARGEIERAEYLQKRQDMLGSSGKG
jgi:putative membrane protein